MTGLQRQLINVAVLVLFIIGGIYYSVVHNEARGALVLLIGILYFVAVPHVWGSRS